MIQNASSGRRSAPGRCRCPFQPRPARNDRAAQAVPELWFAGWMNWLDLASPVDRSDRTLLTPPACLRSVTTAGRRYEEEVGQIEFETLLYEEADGVAVVTLNRPEVHNAFNEVMQDELRHLWRSLKTNDDIRSIVLTGSGEKAFCTGMDRADVPVEEGEYFFHALTYEDPGRSIGPRSQGLWKPVLAAVNGMACGGAFYLLGQVDIIVAAEHATFFDPHVTYGMPAVFEPALMGERMPFGEVMRMTLMGNRERISAQKAERIGLVTQVVPSSEVVETTRQLAVTIASYSPAAVQASLRAVWASREMSPGQMLELGNLFLNLATTAESLRSSQEVFQTRKPEPPTIR